MERLEASKCGGQKARLLWRTMALETRESRGISFLLPFHLRFKLVSFHLILIFGEILRQAEATLEERTSRY